jgi:general secretion pathway protein A
VYTDYWKLERKPFENAPDPAFFYHAPEHAEAVERLGRLIVERRGAGLLTGDYGAGKTTLIRVLDEELDLDQHRVAYLNYPRLAAEELAGEILRQLGAEAVGDPIERMHQLGELLLQTSQEGSHTLVVIDEAQIIPDDKVLVELGRLLDFRLDGEPMVTFLLVGEPKVRERILRLPRFDQKIAVRHHISSLDAHQTRAYIGFRLDVAGADGALFTEGAIEYVYDRTHGVPREINSMCDMALFLGARKKAAIVDERVVLRVA